MAQLKSITNNAEQKVSFMATDLDVSMGGMLVADLAIETAVPDSIVEFVPGLVIDIGARLKLIRERNGLSQRELAKRAGITNSNISMIEQGLVSPSVNSLAKVLNGIPMTLAHFFACDQVDIGQVVYSAAVLEAGQCNHGNCLITQTVATEKSRRQLDMTRQVYPAGSDTGAEPLRHKSELSALVVAGQIELTAGIQIHELNEGDAFYLAALQPYRIRNRKDITAVIVCTSLHI